MRINIWLILWGNPSLITLICNIRKISLSVSQCWQEYEVSILVTGFYVVTPTIFTSNDSRRNEWVIAIGMSNSIIPHMLVRRNLDLTRVTLKHRAFYSPGSPLNSSLFPRILLIKNVAMRFGTVLSQTSGHSLAFVVSVIINNLPTSAQLECLIPHYFDTLGKLDVSTAWIAVNQVIDLVKDNGYFLPRSQSGGEWFTLLTGVEESDLTDVFIMSGGWGREMSWNTSEGSFLPGDKSWPHMPSKRQIYSARSLISS